jgi:D-serine deaminase-like pyridoxal phosphate-dependent protein
LTHEGHVYTAARDEQERRQLAQEACSHVVETLELFHHRGINASVASVGSSATARYGLGFPGITEVRPGTYVFNDRTQVAQGAARLGDVAACVVATVVSRPAADRAVIDAGSKALSSDLSIVPDAPRSFGLILGHPDWEVARLSEEHGIVTIPPHAGIKVGDRVAVVPNHICPVLNLHDAVTLVEHDQVVDRWPVAARGRLQ